MRALDAVTLLQVEGSPLVRGVRTKPEICGYTPSGAGRRRRPTDRMRRTVLERQRNRCMYCDNPFDWLVRRRGDLVRLKLQWDHFVPYAFSGANPGDNWVAACHVCNNIKGPQMFDTIAEAQQFIRPRWAEKGYDMAAINPKGGAR